MGTRPSQTSRERIAFQRDSYFGNTRMSMISLLGDWSSLVTHRAGTFVASCPLVGLPWAAPVDQTDDTPSCIGEDRVGTRQRRLGDIPASWPYEGGGKLSPLPWSQAIIKSTRRSIPVFSFGLSKMEIEMNWRYDCQ